MIWIVGAGCYHPDMLTIGAVKVLQQADCVLYDHLVNKEILQFTHNCECIDVGKVGHGKAYKQEDIHKLLVQKSQQYSHVVRLKGGDPYIYGRGAEEVAYCRQHKIPCQYIPGISSAMGGLGYAGIAVTQRYKASGVSMHTCHYQDGKDHLNYEQIVNDTNTHVFFMGANKVKSLVEKCLEYGMRPDMGIALASHLTYPHQKVVTATLATIFQQDISELTSPLLIVIGDVVNNQALLDNRVSLPCFGKKVLLLHVGASSWPDENILLEEGIFTYQRQVGRVVYTYKQDVDLTTYSKLVFVSQHAIEGFLYYLRQHHLDLRVLANKTIYCIGQKTANYFADKGIVADVVVSSRNEIIDNDVLWIQGQDQEHSLCVYAIEPVHFEIEDMYDAIGVSCPFALEALESKHPNKDLPLFCFAHRSYEKAKALGYTNIICCESRKEVLLQTMVRYFRLESKVKECESV